MDGFEFIGFSKIARLRRDCVITEKIDGTNAQIYIGNDGTFLTGSRNQWITPEKDNHGFARWAMEHKNELMTLGPGRHYGEWWGAGINRKYGLQEKRFSLFRQYELYPSCVSLVPVLYTGVFSTVAVQDCIDRLIAYGSVAAPGWLDPEGIVVYHCAAGVMFKQTIKGDDKPKTLVDT